MEIYTWLTHQLFSLTRPKCPSPVLARPISGILAAASNHIDKVLGYDPLSLLARMKFIKPQERIRVGRSNTIATSNIAVVDEARHVERCSPIEIFRRIVVDVRKHCIHVVRSKCGTGVSLVEFDRKGGAELVDGIDSGNLLEHAVVDFGLVELRLVCPVLVVAYTAVTGRAIKGGELEGSDVHEDKEAAAVVVDGLNLVVDAV